MEIECGVARVGASSAPQKPRGRDPRRNHAQPDQNVGRHELAQRGIFLCVAAVRGARPAERAEIAQTIDAEVESSAEADRGCARKHPDPDRKTTWWRWWRRGLNTRFLLLGGWNVSRKHDSNDEPLVSPDNLDRFLARTALVLDAYDSLAGIDRHGAVSPRRNLGTVDENTSVDDLLAARGPYLKNHRRELCFDLSGPLCTIAADQRVTLALGASVEITACIEELVVQAVPLSGFVRGAALPRVRWLRRCIARKREGQREDPRQDAKSDAQSSTSSWIAGRIRASTATSSGCPGAETDDIAMSISCSRLHSSPPSSTRSDRSLLTSSRTATSRGKRRQGQHGEQRPECDSAA